MKIIDCNDLKSIIAQQHKDDSTKALSLIVSVYNDALRDQADWWSKQGTSQQYNIHYDTKDLKILKIAHEIIQRPLHRLERCNLEFLRTFSLTEQKESLNKFFDDLNVSQIILDIVNKKVEGTSYE